MSNYAQIVNGKVVNVIVADAEFVTRSDLDYVLLSRGGIGWTYNQQLNQFVAPQPYKSWTLNKNNEWEAPKPRPNDIDQYHWEENLKEWIKDNER